MGSDRIQVERKSSSTLTPGFKPEESSFLKQRYQDRVEAETDSFTEDKQQNSSEQSNATPPFLGHSFGRMSVLPIQAKLTIGQPGDKYEQEADRVASQVIEQINVPSFAQSTQGQSVQWMGKPEEEELQAKPEITALQGMEEEKEEEELQAKPIISDLQRSACSSAETRRSRTLSLLSPKVQREAMPEEGDLQAKSILQPGEVIGGGEASTDLDSAINHARGSGQSLDEGLQRSMGQAMGVDFSGVRVHTDAQSDQLNQSIQAKAFTTGQDVFFRQGEYQPRSLEGQVLIAHELTHVVQQNGPVVNSASTKTVGLSTGTRSSQKPKNELSSSQVIQRTAKGALIGGAAGAAGGAAVGAAIGSIIPRIGTTVGSIGGAIIGGIGGAIAGHLATAQPTVTLPRNIRAASSPAGMPDRIPPRVNTPVNVGISGLSIFMPDVNISVEGMGGGNGTVTVNGANSVDLKASSTVQLRGVNQTSVGNAGGLRLVAKQGSTVLASSAYFSVSSIPQNWSISFNSLITGGRRGIKVNNNWESDSGNVADLDQAERSEQVQYGAGSGSLAGKGAGAHNSGYLAANNPPLRDSHGAPVAFLTSVGSIVAEQTFIFKDKRTGANNIPAKNSGYRLTRNVTEPTPGNLEITTTKQGAATTANGFSSSAGSGTVSKTQAV